MANLDPSVMFIKRRVVLQIAPSPVSSRMLCRVVLVSPGDGPWIHRWRASTEWKYTPGEAWAAATARKGWWCR